jgi:hypothetical protein
VTSIIVGSIATDSNDAEFPSDRSIHDHRAPAERVVMKGRVLWILHVTEILRILYELHHFLVTYLTPFDSVDIMIRNNRPAINVLTMCRQYGLSASIIHLGLSFLCIGNCYGVLGDTSSIENGSVEVDVKGDVEREPNTDTEIMQICLNSSTVEQNEDFKISSSFE